MKTYELLALSGVCVAVATGCAERRVEYVPAYQASTVYQNPPGYTYQTQTAYQVPQSTDAGNAPAAPQTAPPPTPPADVVVAQAPPSPQVEVVPVTPGPAYVWAPGYWVWNNSEWQWQAGHWTIPPRERAVLTA